MRISLEYQLMEVNIVVATESYTTGCNCKTKHGILFVINQAKNLKLELSAFKTQEECDTINVYRVL